MKSKTLTILTLLAAATLAACSRDKVQPDDAKSDSALSPEAAEAKNAADYKKRQDAFADSVLKGTPAASKIAEKMGRGAEVGSVKVRDSLLVWVEKTPECFKQGRDVDPYLKGTVSFYIHFNPTGSDVIHVQESTWTSQAGNITDKCFNDAATKWKLGMGLAKQGYYVVQVQFK